jgi:hypothetical protein
LASHIPSHKICGDASGSQWMKSDDGSAQTIEADQLAGSHRTALDFT